jgi:hypothetical protein
LERLITSPAFVLNVPRSGSTLLRRILDSHPLVCAPGELHLTCLKVSMTAPFAELAMQVLGLTPRELEHLLWDSILHRELVRSAKRVIVEKDPRDLLQWRRFADAWPQARFIFIIRHPGTILASMAAARRGARARAAALQEVAASGEYADLYTASVELAASRQVPTLDLLLDRIELLEEARRHLGGLTIRYEDLVGDPEPVTREVCDFLGVPWDARMLDYGAVDHGPLAWYEAASGDKITAGRIVAPRAAPAVAEVPPQLLSACHAWGYI